jgi:hypothetical protein
MKLAARAFAGVASLGLGLAACTTVTENSAPASSSSGSASSSAPTASGTQQAGPSSRPPAPPSPSAAPNGTSPWAVVSAYYGDVESGNFQQAWALLDSGATTGQTYQQFVDGYACTGAQQLSEVSSSGDQVTFSLTATDTCNGQVQHYTGTDTVQNGKIIAADVHAS